MAMVWGISGCGDPSAPPAPIIVLADDAVAPSGDVDSAADASTELMPDAAVVAATVRVINPGTGGAFPGVNVTGPRGQGSTDASGRVSLEVAVGPYQFALDAPGARMHRVWGVAAGDAFEQITYVSPDMITAFVYGGLGLADDLTKGIVVVGLDTPSLAPAIGAMAALNVAHDPPFVFAGSRPAAGHVIPADGQGFVTFPNVPPGPVEITVSYPDGICRIFPGETSQEGLEVVAGEVAVVAFTCRVGG